MYSYMFWAPKVKVASGLLIYIFALANWAAMSGGIPLASGEGESRLDVFGGIKPWESSEWTAQDDTVRGGVSSSYLSISPDCSCAVFGGLLDSETLGGAGFASQRTTADTAWDLSYYEGLELFVKSPGSCGDPLKDQHIESSNMTFTLNLKDVLPPKNANGTEPSSLEYAYNFRLSKYISSEGEHIVLPFKDFKASYRGRDVPDAPPLDISNIRRFSLMARSFFDAQSGPFELPLGSIAAVKVPAYYPS